MKDNFTMSWEEAVQWLRSQSDQREFVRACYYDDPLEESAERFNISTEWRAVKDILSDVKPGKALDVGAGRGISSYALARDGWSVTSLEPDNSPIVGNGAIKQLIKGNLDITIVDEYGETLPFEENSFDLVYGRAVLHHADDLDKFCQEMLRVLKPGGMFLACREHVISKESDLKTFLDSHPLHSLYGGENAFLLKDYINAIQNSGIILKKIYNPYQSDINLYPLTVKSLKQRLARKIGFLPGVLIPSVLVHWLGLLSQVPGRLYSFVGYKPEYV